MTLPSLFTLHFSYGDFHVDNKTIDKGKWLVYCSIMKYNSKRKEILGKRLDGMTYEAIGKEIGLSRQRVQQIISPGKYIRNWVISQAQGKCQKCGILVGRAGHVHHIGNSEENYNCIDNLQLLCLHCHHAAHHAAYSTETEIMNPKSEII